ncbi:MAG: DUF2807 domain-containing protein [Anaerolineales bacterium]|nr:DUF2807 domain-containing protein [Anaerolineales bacterium]
MEKKLSLTVTGAILLLLSACGMAVIPGSGKIVEEVRDVSGYSQIVFSAPGELTIEQNGHEGLTVEADDNLLQYIHTSVQGDVLYIYVEPNVIQLYPSKPIHYTLDVVTLTRVTLNGSGVIRSDELIASNLDFDLNGSGDILIADVKSQNSTLALDGSGEYRFGSFMTSQFTVSVDGSGDIAMQEVIAKTADLEIDGSGKLAMTDVIADTLNVKVDGSGDSTLSGEVNHQAIAIHGSGSYDAGDLQSQVTTVKIIGSGDSKVWATDELNITIAGSGDITYRGKPAVTQTVTGSGNITRLARQ